MELSDELYVRFRNLLLSRTGLHYPPHRRDDLAHGLSQALVASSLRTPAELYESVAASPSGKDWDVLVEHLTIGETRFFRNEAHFDALRQHIFPELIARRAALRVLRVWSAGCASGEEPYSIAMLLSDLLPDIENWSVSILATDINPAFLRRAREGLYSAWSFRETSESLRSRFFTPEDNRWRLNESIRRMVNFMPLNLAESQYPSIANGTYALDMIICRNVTIYFDPATTRQVAERFYATLAPGGWLLVGHAEPQASTYHQFEPHNYPNAIFYRKSLDAPLFAVPTPPTPPAPASKPPPRPKPTASPPKPTASPPKPAASPPKPAASPPPKPAPSAALPITPSVPLASPRPTQPPPRSDMWPALRERVLQSDKTRAEALLREFLEGEPNHPGALVELARLFADRGEWNTAQRHCEQSLEGNPLSVEACYLLAQIYEHQGALDDALAMYRRAIYIDRNFILGLLGMANVWRQMGLAAEARRGYRSVLKQLATIPFSAVVPGTDGATAHELMRFVKEQLDRLPPS
jgi:chemotaxis protein methyltransferase CheR